MKLSKGAKKVSIIISFFFFFDRAAEIVYETTCRCSVQSVYWFC